MALLESLILLSILIFLLYKWATAKYHVLKARNVPHDEPVALIGNLGMDMFMGKSSLLKVLIDLHEKYKSKKVYGFYNLRDPLILINDTELIKKIGIKDFDHFTNHGASFPDDETEMSRSLIILKDRKWKEMRNTLSPAFTGSKMRLMYELINECSIEGIKYLKTETESSGKLEYEFEMKDYFTRFANDVIASAAFGIKVNSFQDKENDFYNIGIKITKFTGWTLIKALLYGLMPKLLKLLRVKIFDRQNINYFTNIVLDTIKYREQNKVIRPDMINLLLEAKKSAVDKNIEQTELTDIDIVAQCLLFFFAGFETISTTLCFALHELMENPAVQEQLYNEIKEMEEQLNGQSINYDNIMKMKYMDMVISETMRKWPTAAGIDRICSKDYDLIDEDGNLIVSLKKDDIVWISVIGIQRDAENFPNPIEFSPDRFSDENKDNIKPFTYMPFGVGPRNCIGNRFALMELKSMLYHIILNFKIIPSSKASKDLLSSMNGFQMVPKEKFWIKIEKRNK